MKKRNHFMYVLTFVIAAIACTLMFGCSSKNSDGDADNQASTGLVAEMNVRYVSEETMHNDSSKQRYFILTGKDTAIYHYWSNSAIYDVYMKYTYVDSNNAIATFDKLCNLVSIYVTEQDIIDNTANKVFHISVTKNYVSIQGIGEFVNINFITN